MRLAVDNNKTRRACSGYQINRIGGSVFSVSNVYSRRAMAYFFPFSLLFCSFPSEGRVQVGTWDEGPCLSCNNWLRAVPRLSRCDGEPATSCTQGTGLQAEEVP